MLLPLVIGFLALPQADTLAEARVSAAQPVVRPAEEVDLRQIPAPPARVADVLRRFTGVAVKDYGGAGGLKTVNVRSLGSEHVGVFLDGIQVDNAQNMQVDLGRFSTGGLGHIALYNGQKTSRLQTAKEYASGAAVYLESAPPEGRALSVHLRGGAFGTVNPWVQADLPLGPRLTLRAGAEYLSSVGRYPFSYGDTTLLRDNSDIRSLRLESQLFGQVKGGQWRLRLYGYGSERGFPGPVVRRAGEFPFSAERQADEDLFVQGAWKQEWSPRYATALRWKYVRNYTHYNTHAEENPMALPYDLHYLQQSSYLSLAQSFVLAGPWFLDVASDVQHNALDSDVGQFVTPRRTTLTQALSLRLAWKRFRLAAHLAYQGAWDTFDSPEAGGWSRENRYRDALMPSLSLFWAPAEGLEVNAFTRRSVRLPSFNDLYYSLMGNANLVPESAFQTGVDLRFSRGWLALRVSPYYNRVSEKIVAIPTLSQFRWTMLNIGLADILGADCKAEGQFRFAALQAAVVLRYTFQQALDHSTPGSQTWGNQIPYIPRHSGGIDLDLRWNGWTLSWNTLATGGRWSRTANIPDYYLAPWSLSDASLSWHLPMQEGFSLDLGVQCRNVLNCSYQLVQGYPMPGRHWMFNLDFNW